MKPKFYLLSGNGSFNGWWQDALPYFSKHEALPIDLPGSGDNLSPHFHSLEDLADALLEMTEAGHPIFAVGINALVVLHALVKRPKHFSRVLLLAPVGAFLWERRFVKVMSNPILRKTAHFLLSRFPKLFARKFSSKKWTDAQYRRMGEGYRRCRAFEEYFLFVRPHNALTLFEWIETPIELIWGTEDKVLGVEQAAAWDSILPRADLSVTLRSDWEHYPYIDAPQAFAETVENFPRGFNAHTKAGRLKLATLAGLPVPKNESFLRDDLPKLNTFLQENGRVKSWAVRSSSWSEDKIDNSNAGRFHTYLRVPTAEVESRVKDLHGRGIQEVVVQQFVEPKRSGVAFVRTIASEIDWVDGHLEKLVDGTAAPNRAVISKLGGEWTALGDEKEFIESCHTFLQSVIKKFHYAPSDIEWAWDGGRFYLFQIRPVTTYNWRRCLTSANLDEILPRRVSRLMEHAQRRAALSISRIWALWDERILNDNEPFSVVYDDASYINSDVFLSRFFDWGLPSSLYANEIGGAVPKLDFNALKFLRTVPRFLKMLRVCRSEMLRIETELKNFERELEKIRTQPAHTADAATVGEREEQLANWFVRYYAWIVRTNMLINAALSSSGGSFLGKGKTVYDAMNARPADFPHRLAYESDPAVPRNSSDEKALMSFPQWNFFTKLWHTLGLPGLGGKYFEVREWFRDNNMRLFHRLHNAMNEAMKGTSNEAIINKNWFELHDGVRTRSGTFWQDGGTAVQQQFSFVIYPGVAEGTVGQDILIEDALEPGRYELYKAAKAVIARTGGRLSHGATLLRELKKPSAVVAELSTFWHGKRARYDNGTLTAL